MKNIIQKNNLNLAILCGTCLAVLGFNSLTIYANKALSGELSPFRVIDFRSTQVKRGIVNKTCQEFKVQGYQFYLTQKHCLEEITPDKLLISDRPVRSDNGQEVQLSGYPNSGLAHILYELNGRVTVIPISVITYDPKKGIGLYKTKDGSLIPAGISGAPVVTGSVVVGSASAAITQTNQQINSDTGYFTGNKVP